MLNKTDISISLQDLQTALDSLPSDDFRQSINQPSGRFFYDPWVVKSEYTNSIWNSIIESLGRPVGEARIIQLKPGSCYHSHADIDDRYHLNLSGEHCYLVDLEEQTMHKLTPDGYWYSMDAGKIHSAVNFGATTRVQLVVRKLLNDNVLKNDVRVRVYWTVINSERARHLLDNNVSPWLNHANKNGYINDFSHTATDVTFNIEKEKLEEFKKLLPENFVIEYL